MSFPEFDLAHALEIEISGWVFQDLPIRVKTFNLKGCLFHLVILDRAWPWVFRPLPSISSTLETPRDQRLSHDFYDENVNLQSGYYDSSFERNSGSYQPMSHRSGPTSGYGSPIGTRSPAVGSPHGTPRSGRHGSGSENSSGLDADSIFNRVHSQVFPDGTFPDETFPSPPPQLQNQDPPGKQITLN